MEPKTTHTTGHTNRQIRTRPTLPKTTYTTIKHKNQRNGPKRQNPKQPTLRLSKIIIKVYLKRRNPKQPTLRMRTNINQIQLKPLNPKQPAPRSSTKLDKVNPNLEPQTGLTTTRHKNHKVEPTRWKSQQLTSRYSPE